MSLKRDIFTHIFTVFFVRDHTYMVINETQLILSSFTENYRDAKWRPNF